MRRRANIGEGSAQESAAGLGVGGRTFRCVDAEGFAFALGGAVSWNHLEGRAGQERTAGGICEDALSAICGRELPGERPAQSAGSRARKVLDARAALLALRHLLRTYFLETLKVPREELVVLGAISSERRSRGKEAVVRDISSRRNRSDLSWPYM